MKINLTELFKAESNSSLTKNVKNALDVIAKKFWIEQGAKFGKIQTIKDFKNLDYIGKTIQQYNIDDPYFATPPTRITDKSLDTKFFTSHAQFEVDGYNLICAIYVKFYKKDGTFSQPIKLSWYTLRKDFY